MTNDRNQRGNAWRANFSNFATWRNARTEKRLTDIDIAKASDDSLIEQCRFHGRLAALEGCDKVIFMEIVPQRLRSQHRKQLVTVGCRRIQQVHRTKAARIIKSDPRAIFHVKDHMIMFGGLRMRMHKLAKRVTRYRHPP